MNTPLIAPVIAPAPPITSIEPSAYNLTGSPVKSAHAPLEILYLVVPIVPPGAEPCFAIGRKPNGASIFAMLVSF